MKLSIPCLRLPLALLALLSISSLAESQSTAFQVRAKELYLGDGTRLENGVVVIREGKIVKVGPRESADPKLALIEHDGVLTAGLVACQSLSGVLGEASDGTRSMLPEARMADALDPDHSDFERALRAGITCIVVAPEATNLTGGLTTVVKTSDGQPLSREAHLAISYSSQALGDSQRIQLRFFGRAEDGSLEDTTSSNNGSRLPTSYAGAKRMLSDSLKDSSDKSSSFARVARGELPVLLEVWDRNEVMRAAALAAEFGLKGALRGAPLGGDPTVTKAIQKSGLGLILGPFKFGQSLRSLQSVTQLAEAGIPLAFALDAPAHAPESFRLSAAMAVSAGADPDLMLRGMTSVGAMLAGVDQRVGSIKPGMDADFVLWSAHPVNLSSSVQAVYVNGKLAWRQSKKEGQAR